MYLSDSITVSHPDVWCRDVWAAWSVIATQSVVDAARRASAEQIRSLHVLLAEMSAQEDSDLWEAMAAATYHGIAEASGNRVYGTLLYDLWQALAQSGDRWDVAARLWPMRQWTEQSLRAVVAGIASYEPELARKAMERHIRGTVQALDA